MPFEVDDVISALMNVMELQSKLTHDDKKTIAYKHSKTYVNGIMKDLYKRYIYRVCEDGGNRYKAYNR